MRLNAFKTAQAIRSPLRRGVSKIDPYLEILQDTTPLMSSLRRGFSRVAAAIAFLAACTAASSIFGCLAPFQATVKQTDKEPGIVRDNEPGEKSASLIKPEIRSEDAQSPARRDQSNGGPPRKPAVEMGPKAESPGASKGEREDQQVKKAALEMAKAFASVVKIRICHAVDGDQWWVTLYDDTGTAIDLKQYTWNRQSEKLDPYLVLKRIPRSQLYADIARKKQGTACEVIDPPRPTP